MHLHGVKSAEIGTKLEIIVSVFYCTNVLRLHDQFIRHRVANPI